MIRMADCAFCNIASSDIIAENDLALAFFDRFPVNRGHALIIPKRHVATFFDASEAEQDAINRLLAMVRNRLERLFSPDGYNIGVNVGAAAGQTVFHLHVHLIPRYAGDVPDPRGGVRRIKPSLVPYIGEGEHQ